MDFNVLLLSTYLFHAFLAVLILFITFIAAKYVQRFFATFEGTFAKSHTKFDVTRYRFARHIVVTGLYFFGIVFAISLIPPLRHVALSILASSGILALIVGFASQQTFSNIVSGVLIEIFRPIKVGDLIKVPSKNIMGTVEDITLRDTLIKTLENSVVIIPNSIMGSEIIENVPWQEQRSFIDLYLNYSASVEQALELIHSTIEKNPYIVDRRTPEQKKQSLPVAELKILELTLTSVHLRLWFWTLSQQNAEKARCSLYQSIKKSFDENKIEFAVTDISS